MKSEWQEEQIWNRRRWYALSLFWADILESAIISCVVNTYEQDGTE